MDTRVVEHILDLMAMAEFLESIMEAPDPAEPSQVPTEALHNNAAEDPIAVWHYEKINELAARITINRETGNRVMAHVQTLRMEAMKLWEFVE